MAGHAIFSLKLDGKIFQVLTDIDDFLSIDRSKLTLKRCTRSVDYVSVRLGKDYLARLILGYKGKNVVDHINGSTMDNRKSNLRIITPLQNSHNRRGYTNAMYSKYKGVSFDKTRKNKPWYAKISIQGTYYKKNFDTELEAALKYDEWAAKYHEEFAYLNFPKLKDF